MESFYLVLGVGKLSKILKVVSTLHCVKKKKEEEEELYSSINPVKGIFLTDYVNNVYFKLIQELFSTLRKCKNKSEKKL